MAKTKTSDSKLDIVINSINEKFGKGSIFAVNDDAIPDSEFLKTSSIGINRVLGGGIASGRIISIEGESQCGKTSLLLDIIANIHKIDSNAICAFIDFEAALDLKYAQALGVDLDRLLIAQPSHAEEGCEIVDMLVRSGTIKVIGVDSVAAMVPKAEIEGEMSDQQVGLQARIMSKLLRKITALANETSTTVIFTNQYRESINMMGYGERKSRPGGKALEFYASQRIELKYMGAVKQGEEVIGRVIKVKAAKNKLAPPLKEMETILTFGKGINARAELITTAKKEKIITTSGAWSYYNDTSIGQGLNGVERFLIENPAIEAEILQKIMDKQ